MHGLRLGFSNCVSQRMTRVSVSYSVHWVTSTRTALRDDKGGQSGLFCVLCLARSRSWDRPSTQTLFPAAWLQLCHSLSGKMYSFVWTMKHTFS